MNERSGPPIFAMLILIWAAMVVYFIITVIGIARVDHDVRAMRDLVSTTTTSVGR